MIQEEKFVLGFFFKDVFGFAEHPEMLLLDWGINHKRKDLMMQLS